MADHRSPARQQIQVQPLQYSRYDAGDFQSSNSGPSASQILAVVALLPVGGTLLALAGITFVGSLIGLAVTTPLFVICSPVIVPAVATIGFAVAGFLGSGAFGLTGLSSLSWLVNYFRQAKEFVPEQMEQAKKRAQELAAYAGQKTKDVGHTIQIKAPETGRESGRT